MSFISDDFGPIARKHHTWRHFHTQAETKSFTELPEADQERIMSEITTDLGTVFKVKYTTAPPIPLCPRTSSLGTLDRFAVEIHQEIAIHLDFDSLRNICFTSYKGKSIIESLPGFTDMMKHARGVISFLDRERVLSFHSFATLRKAFSSKNCVCGDYGPYLFLLTGERCCGFCLLVNENFAVITRRVAIRRFGPQSVLKLARLPGFGLDEGNSSLKFSTWDNSSLCVAMFEWYSEKQVEETFRRCSTGMNFGSSGYKQELEVGPLGTLSNKQELVVPMPYLSIPSGSTVEWGLCCSQCKNDSLGLYSMEQSSYLRVDDIAIACTKLEHGVPKLERLISRLITHAAKRTAFAVFTKTEFSKHIQFFDEKSVLLQQYERKHQLLNQLFFYAREAELAHNLSRLARQDRIININKILKTIRKEIPDAGPNSPFNIDLPIIRIV